MLDDETFDDTPMDEQNEWRPREMDLQATLQKLNNVDGRASESVQLESPVRAEVLPPPPKKESKFEPLSRNDVVQQQLPPPNARQNFIENQAANVAKVVEKENIPPANPRAVRDSR